MAIHFDDQPISSDRLTVIEILAYYFTPYKLDLQA
jgi:hypothetical protein